MTQKRRFEELVKDIDAQFKKIEEKNRRANRAIQKTSKSGPSLSTVREQKLKQHQENEKSIIKGKLKTAAVVFITGHLMIIPAYMNFPDLIPGIFFVASFSLGIICIAVIDYS